MSPRFGANKNVSRKISPQTTAIHPAIETSSSTATRYPSIPESAPMMTLRINCTYILSERNEAVAGGIIIKATTRTAPTDSNATTDVSDARNINT